jgi:hypothetical protein
VTVAWPSFWPHVVPVVLTVAVGCAMLLLEKSRRLVRPNMILKQRFFIFIIYSRKRI